MGTYAPPDAPGKEPPQPVDVAFFVRRQVNRIRWKSYSWRSSLYNLNYTDTGSPSVNVADPCR